MSAAFFSAMLLMAIAAGALCVVVALIIWEDRPRG